MYYNNDKPINDMNQDLLGRKTFAKQLGKFIYDLKEDSGLVIGIFAKWGDGKTSIINITEKEIIELSEKDKNAPLFIKFSPWNYSDKNNLISIFFRFLSSKINIRNNENLKKNIALVLNSYADAIDCIGENSMHTKLIKVGFKGAVNIASEKLLQTPDLEQIKEKINKVLKIK